MGLSGAACSGTGGKTAHLAAGSAKPQNPHYQLISRLGLMRGFIENSDPLQLAIPLETALISA